MKPETEQAIDEIFLRIVECPIPIIWKSESPMPGTGERKSTFRGPGMDFLEIDYHQLGDDPRFIDWNATAQTGGEVPMQVVYQEDKEIKAYVLVDISDSMEFGTVRTTKRTVAAEMAASIFYSLNKTKDKVGYTIFTRHGVLETMPARSAMTNLYPALTTIMEADNMSGVELMDNPGDGLAKALSGLPPRRSLVFVISDFINMTEKDWAELAEMSVLHDVVCIYVQDRRERELPQLVSSGLSGWIFGWLGCFYTIEDYQGQRRMIWNSTRTRRKYAENFRRHEAAITGALDDRNCQWMVISTEEGDAAIPKVLELFGTHC